MKHALELALSNGFELSSKVTVNILWIRCIMMVCMRMSLVLCSQVVHNYARAFLFQFSPVFILSIWLYLFNYLEWNAMS
jgi:hypothetical protein